MSWKVNRGSLGRTLMDQHRRVNFVSVDPGTSGQEVTWPDIVYSSKPSRQERGRNVQDVMSTGRPPAEIN